jgi:glycosyltransferase involved in cell wall biosynthesis
MPVFNVKREYLEECIESVISQFYKNWELCIVDDCSTSDYIVEILEQYKTMDERIHVEYREQNGHISEASNTAINIAIGEYIVLLDDDDVLPPFSLYEIVKVMNSYPKVDLVFSNEDKLRDGMRTSPFFKRGWDEKALLKANIVCHIAVYRRAIVNELNGFRTGYEGAQDWDLALRFTEKTKNIIYIPKILYHWRISETSTALDESIKPYVLQAQKRTIEDAVKRRGANYETSEQISK